MSSKPRVTSIRIGPVDYAVEYVPDLRDENGKLDGRIGYSQTKIQLDASMSPQARVVATLHEVLHAITMHIGRPKISQDEAFIDALAYGVYQLIRDNPELVKLITHAPARSAGVRQK